MKRFAGFALAAGMALMPVAALATSFSAGQAYVLGPQERVEGNLILAAGTASVGGTVTGDLIATGGMVSVTGQIVGDLLAAGGTVEVSGTVAGDVRAMGGQVVVKGIVRGDLVAAGGAVRILQGATVEGDVSVAGGELVIDGTVRGDVTARVSDEVSVGSKAHITGVFSYHAAHEANVMAGARIDGGIAFTHTNAARNHRAFGGILLAIFGMLTAMKMLAYLGFTALIVWLWRRPALELFVSVRESLVPSMGHGALYGISVPLCAVLLGISIVGIFPAVLLGLLYAATLILTKVLAGMFFGAWLEMMLRKQPVMSLTWQNAIGGVILFALLGWIPVLGWIGHALISLAVFGALWRRIQHWLLS